jgi:hypothetical protein
LAAFIVIAIVAAILLITSVRSQAAPAFLDADTIRQAVATVSTAQLHP